MPIIVVMFLVLAGVPLTGPASVAIAAATAPGKPARHCRLYGSTCKGDHGSVQHAPLVHEGAATLTIDAGAGRVTGTSLVVTPLATTSYTDPDGPAPVVSCVPASANCSIEGTNVVLTGLASGTHFFTIKAQDAGNKRAFAHFVVDVQVTFDLE